MYLNTLHILSYCFNAFVLIYFFYKVPIVSIWKQAAKNVVQKRKIQAKITEAEKKGQKCFTFQDGTNIFAKTQQGAISQYKEILRKRKNNDRLQGKIKN